MTEAPAPDSKVVEQYPVSAENFQDEPIKNHTVFFRLHSSDFSERKISNSITGSINGIVIANKLLTYIEGFSKASFLQFGI